MSNRISNLVQAPSLYDFTYANHGGLVILSPKSGAAEHWVAENLPADAQTWCGGIVIESRYFDHIVAGIEDDGLSIR